MANLFGEEWVENFQRPAEEKARDIAEFLGVDSIKGMSALEVLDGIANRWCYLLGQGSAAGWAKEELSQAGACSADASNRK